MERFVAALIAFTLATASYQHNFMITIYFQRQPLDVEMRLYLFWGHGNFSMCNSEPNRFPLVVNVWCLFYCLEGKEIVINHFMRRKVNAEMTDGTLSDLGVICQKGHIRLVIWKESGGLFIL